MSGRSALQQPCQPPSQLIIFFIGLGVFNAVTTWIEDIVRPRGFSITQAGLTGGLMGLGGIVGALVLPAPRHPVVTRSQTRA